MMKRILLAILALLTMSSVLWMAVDGTLSYVLFWGRFHSLLVHFPIGFLLLAGSAEAYRMVRPKAKVETVVSLSLALGTAGSMLSALTGYLLSFEGGFAGDTLYWHLRLGILVAVVAGGALLLRTLWQFLALGSLEKGYRVALFVSVVLLLLTGHFGGVLAHGPDYLTAYLPSPVRSFFGLSPSISSGAEIDPDTALAFDDVILPILRDDCGGCHNSTRKRGGLDLLSETGIRAGGNNGKVILPGDPVNSELIRRMVLRPSDLERMPPGNRSPADLGKVAVLSWWIEEDASFQAKVKDLTNQPFIVEAYLNRVTKPQPSGTDGVFAIDVSRPSDGQLDALEEAGFVAGFLAEGKPFLDVRLPRGRILSAEMKSPLIGVAKQIVWLDLSGTELLPGWAEVLPQLEHLVRLNLSMTNISEDDLAYLAKLQHLEYLNLYDTQISDSGLVHLEGLPELSRVYLWQTRVTEAAATRLGNSRPGLEVSLGEVLQIDSAE